MSDKKRDTVGKISSDLLISSQKETIDHSPAEQMREQLEDYESNIAQCITDFKAHDTRNAKEFYVVVNTKKEKLMPNVIRNYFYGRYSCPTPTFDQTVYKYTLKNDRLDFLWVIPSKDTCRWMKEDPLQVPQDQRQLLKYVLDFMDGTLDNTTRVLNGELKAN